MRKIQSALFTVSLATLTTAATAGGFDVATETYSTGTGLTTAFQAFTGTPSVTSIRSSSQIWVGDVAGLVSELDNPFYNDTTNFIDGTPVLAFGPSSLGLSIEIGFGVDVVDFSVVIYDIETSGAVQITAFDGDDQPIFDSGPLSATKLNQHQFSTQFDPPARTVYIHALNQDGLMLSPIDISYSPLTCNLADLNDDGELDFIDISAFLSAYGAGDPLADLNNDFNYDFLDISAFVSAYSDGCP